MVWLVELYINLEITKREDQAFFSISTILKFLALNVFAYILSLYESVFVSNEWLNVWNFEIKIENSAKILEIFKMDTFRAT